VRVTLFGRLLAILCGVAAASTGLALLLQERSLAADLSRAARARLDGAAAAAAELLDTHLRSLTQRYQAVSGTPQFRALLELHDVPTLAHYAGTLVRQQGAGRIAFLDPGGRLVAAAGDAEVAPAAAAEGLVAAGGSPFATVLVPLETDGRPVGALLAAEPVGEELLAQWSRLCGARVALRAGEPEVSRGLARTVRPLGGAGGLFLRVEMSLDAEDAAIARARRNLLLAGSLALVVALAAGAALSRGLSAPIRQIKHAAERVGEGDLTVRVESTRRDEIGDVARAFEAMAANLRATLGSADRAADNVDAAAARIARVAAEAAQASREQARDRDQAATSLERIDAQVSALEKAAGELSSALSESVEGSSASFLELGHTGEALARNASQMASRVDDIATSIDGMIDSARQIGAGAERLLAAADETVASMHEMEASAREVHANAGGTSDLARQTLESAETGVESVRRAAEGMAAIRDAAQHSRAAMQQLGARVAEIGSILAVIDEVAGDTGLLALNAAVIAAQSGERGRAFGVVAAEMKALAQRVGAGTREIEDLVHAIQRESEGAAAAIEQNADRVAEGVSLAEATRTALDRIAQAAHASQDRMAQIVRATDAQASTAGHVSERMERVHEGVRSIRSAGSEQSSGNEVVRHSSLALREVARQVQEAIGAQSGVASRIGESVEVVRETVGQIQAALHQQADACRQAVDLLRASRVHTAAQERSSRTTEAAVRELVREAEVLRAQIRRFRI
jgi:methyl-accepting chemotaxis protein